MKTTPTGDIVLGYIMLFYLILTFILTLITTYQCLKDYIRKNKEQS